MRRKVPAVKTRNLSKDFYSTFPGRAKKTLAYRESFGFDKLPSAFFADALQSTRCDYGREHYAQGQATEMFLFILDSLGNSELLVILVAALIFFGPRKLPHLSRTIGKSLSEFRRASEDFKRTWAQEVALEGDDRSFIAKPAIAPADASILGPTVQRNAVQAAAEESPGVDSPPMEDTTEALSSAQDEADDPTSKSLSKQDWL